VHVIPLPSDHVADALARDQGQVDHLDQGLTVARRLQCRHFQRLDFVIRDYAAAARRSLRLDVVDRVVPLSQAFQGGECQHLSQDAPVRVVRPRRCRELLQVLRANGRGDLCRLELAKAAGHL
jgi:hypothetical protein